MDEKTRERLIHILTPAMGWVLAHLLAERFSKEPRHKGVADDAREALFKAGVSVGATICLMVVFHPWGG